MFDPKIVKVMANAPLPDVRTDLPNWSEALMTRALTALCAHLRITPEALNALAAGKAVVVPREMDEAEWSSAAIRMDAHPQSLFAERMRKMWPVICAASPYAPKGGGDA